VGEETQVLFSAVGNLRAGNITEFEMKFLSKKAPKFNLHFEDNNFPSYIKNIKNRYWFRNKDRKRTTVDYSDIHEHVCGGGIEVSYEKDTDRYFLHCPVDYDWFPENDLRIEKQEMEEFQRVIALDPGVRKFLVGYTPDSTLFVGEGASKVLAGMLLAYDKGKVKWRRIRNYIEDLQWKTVSYLTRTYDILISGLKVCSVRYHGWYGD